MNDPRISSIRDALNLTDVPDADVLDALVLLISNNDWGDKSVRDIHNAMSQRSSVLLWEASSGRVAATSNTTVYNLNLGLAFSDFSAIAIMHDNHGSSNDADDTYISSVFPRNVLTVGDRLQMHTINQWKQVEIVSDTSFKINSGSSGIGIKRIYGFY